jgi:hypothetical protein
MKTTILYTLFILILLSPFVGYTQNNDNEDFDKNVLKFNLTGLLLKNYGIQYERMLTRKTSFALGFRTMPSTTLPLDDLLELDLEDFSSNDLTLGNYAITPEIRFYMGKKGGPRGFYFAPYFRYANHDIGIKNLTFTFEDDEFEDESITKTASFSGNITGMSAGAMFGAQWRLGKAIYLDWWIAGASYGKSSGNFQILTPLDSDEIATIRDELQIELNNIDVPSVSTTLDVNPQGVRVDFKGPWASVRAGLSLGFRF